MSGTASCTRSNWNCLSRIPSAHGTAALRPLELSASPQAEYRKSSATSCLALRFEAKVELRSAGRARRPSPHEHSLSTASGHLHRPQDCSRFVFRLFELALRVGVCDDARARLQVGFLALH